jgi:amidase
VARLRAAGAIILGKTNLSEWANFRSTHATSGWSAMGGLARNPYALDRTACGSSSGSAAAVAAGFAAAAVGSETDGSVTCPSSMNGVTGFKPSLGQVPRTHIVPIAHSQDTAGPITHTVADAALMMAVMSGADAADPASKDSGVVPGPAFAKLGAADLRGKRLGVLRFPAGLYPDLDPLYDDALARLKKAGAVLVEVKLPDDPKIGADENLVLQTEMKADMAAYLATTPANVRPRTLTDLIAFNRRTPAETHLFDQDIFEQSQATKGLTDPAYLSARERSARATGPDGIDRLLAANHLDALVAPTTSVAWRVDLIYGDANPGSFATFPAVAGYPHLTVPMGLVARLPAGLSFIGAKWTDASVLALGEAYQQISPPDPPPGFPATVDPAP